MPLTETGNLYLNHDEILATFTDFIQGKIPDIYLGEDSNIRFVFEAMASVIEQVYAAQQILNEDMFVVTANYTALMRYGNQFGLPMKLGTKATGSLMFTGVGGTYVPISTEVAYDPLTGDEPLFFLTTADGTIPNPGIPTAPTLTDRAIGGNLNGLFEYAITFLTASGETAQGVISSALNVINSQIRLTNIPLGGTGTTGRRIYRQKAGGGFKLVVTIGDNTTVQYDDNITDAALLGGPPAESTAERITILAEAEEPGVDYNAQPGTIIDLTDAPDGLTAVTNPMAFAGGDAPEEEEEFRMRLLETIRAPGTGSPEDLKAWAEAVDGVETATVFPNDNMGVATNGHVTVRISGPDGTIPSSEVQTAVLAELNSKDIANIIIHVGTFTAVSTDVSVTITLETNYILADVSPSVREAITNYVNNLGVGQTLRINGVIDAVFGLPGVADVAVTVPGSNLTTAATQKRIAGTLTVS